MKLLSFNSQDSLAKTLKVMQTRFISLSKLENDFINKYMYLTLFVSYAQIFFQTSQLTGRYFSKSSEQPLTIQTLENAFTFEKLFSYDQNDQILRLTCYGIILYFLIFITSLLITVYEAFKPIQICSFGTRVWSLLIQIHAPVIFFPINNLCIQLQTIYLDESLEISIPNSMVFYCSIVIFIMNTLFAGFPYIFLYDILPNHNSLSSKNFYVDQINLYQKLIVSIIGKILTNNSLAEWSILSIGTTLSVARHFCCLYFLPRYHFKTMALELSLINICSLSALFTLFIFGLIQIFDFNTTKTSYILVLIFLSSLAKIHAKSHYNQLIKKILIKPFKTLNPYKALHKIFTLKYIEKSMKSPNRRTDQIDLYYFYFSMIQSTNENIFFEKDIDSVEINLNTKENQNEVRKKYLENLVAAHNKIDEFKLILARFYAKNLKLYVLAFKTLARIKSSSFMIQNSTKLLRLQIQNQIMNQSETKNGDLNLNEYFIVEKHKESLKTEINKQLQLQNNFWKEFVKSSPDILILQKLSQLIYKQKNLIAQNWTQIENYSKLSFSHLCSLYACFQFLLNDSPSKAKEYIKKANILGIRHNRQKELNISNLYDLNNFNVTIKANQENLGNIVDCSNSIKRLLGYSKNDIIGANIGILMTPFIAERHNNFLQNYINTGQSTYLGRIQTLYVKDRMGSLRKASFWANVHPFIHGEIQLTAIFRIIHNSKEYILLTPQGDVDSCTTKIASKLNIQNKKVNINMICPTFLNICETYSPLPLKPMIIDSGNLGLLSVENSVQSTRNLLSPKEISQSPIYSPKNEFKNNLRLKNNKMNCQLEFIPYSNGFRKVINKPETYECKAKAINVRESYMILLQVEVLDQNEKMPQRVYPQTFIDLKTDTKHKTSQIDENVENPNTGTTELLSPERINLIKRSTRLFNDTKQEGTNITSVQGDSSPLDKFERGRLSASYDVPVRIFMKEASQELKHNKEILYQGNEHSVSGSSTSLKERREAYIEDVFETKYYPKIVKNLLLVIFILFLSNLTLQICLSIKSRKDLKDLNSLTTTLNLANLRADAFTQIGRGARAAFYAQAGFVPKGSTAYKNVLNGFSTNLQVNTPILKSTNSELQLVIQDIDQVFQEQFKAVNVKIYDINTDLTPGTYQKFNTFTAINVYIEKLLQTLQYYLKTNEFIVQRLYYILINSVNDALEATINATNLIFESIIFSFKNIVTMFRVCQILVILLVILGAIVKICFIYQVYNMELTLTQEYLSMDLQSVQLARNRLDYFEKIFQIENFERLENFDFASIVQEEKRVNVLNPKKVKKTVQSIDKRGFQRYYLKKVLLFLLILLLYVLWIYLIYVQMIQKIDKLKAMIKGLNIAQSMLYETSILAFAIGQILCGDTINTVRNRPVEEELVIDLNNFLKRGRDLLEAFTEEDGSYNPLVVQYFSQDSCKFMPFLSTASTQCAAIVKDAKAYGLFPLLARHYIYNSDLYQSYKASNKSFTALSSLVVNLVLNTSPATSVIREVVMALIRSVQGDLTILWDTTTNNLNIFLILCPVTLLAIGFLNWRYMLKELLECANRFKRMMRLTPLNILIMNPNLKGILMISSNGKLQRVNYDI